MRPRANGAGSSPSAAGRGPGSGTCSREASRRPYQARRLPRHGRPRARPQGLTGPGRTRRGTPQTPRGPLAAQGAGGGSPLQHRLRQRRLLHLLRPRRRRRGGARPDAVGLRHHRRPLHRHRLVLLRGDGGHARGRRRVQLHPPRLQRVRQLRHRLGADATYTATIAISALFVPQYLSIFWPILKEPPYNVIGGAITIVVLVVINIIGIKEAASLNVVLALLDLGTQVLIMIIALVLLLEPKNLLSQIEWGIAPTWERFLYGLAIGTVAYTGIETISNMAEEAPRPGQGRAAVHQLRHHRRPRRVHRYAAGGAVVDEGRVQPGARRPRDRQDAPGGGGPRQARGHVRAQVVPTRPRSTYRSRSWRTARRSSRPGADRPRSRPSTGELVTKLHGTPARQQLRGRPGAGHGPLLAGQRRLAALDPRAVGRHPRGDHPLHRHQCRASSASRASPSRWVSTDSCRVCSGRVHPTRLTPYVAICGLRRHRHDAHLARRESRCWRTSTHSGRSSRSPPHTCRSSCCDCGSRRSRARSVRRLNVRFRGVSLPMTAVLGALGTFAVWCVILYYKPLSGFLGIAWVAVGLVGYVIPARRTATP